MDAIRGRRWRRRGLLGLVAGLVVLPLALSSCSTGPTSASSTTSTTTSSSKTSASAPCTAQAITEVVKTATKNFHALAGKGCAGDFAYADVTVSGTGSDTPAATVTVLLKATNGAWKVVNRATYCKPNIVPAGIYQPACETN